MNCNETEILLQLAADGEVTATERVLIDEHLATCVLCRRKEAWLDLLNGELAATSSASSADLGEFAEGVVAQLSAAELLAVKRVDGPRISRSRIVGQPSKKQGRFARVVSAILNRRKTRQKKKSRKPATKGGLIGASVTSIETYRAAKQGVETAASAVSKPVRAVQWVAGIVPKRRRS